MNEFVINENECNTIKSALCSKKNYTKLYIEMTVHVLTHKNEVNVKPNNTKINYSMPKITTEWKSVITWQSYDIQIQIRGAFESGF